MFLRSVWLPTGSIGSMKNFIKSPKGVLAVWGVCSIVFLLVVYIKTSNRPTELAGDGIFSTSGSNASCNVTGINLHGSLLTYLPKGFREDQSLSAEERNVTSSEEVMDIITIANNDRAIKAIVIEVDSGGGSPVAGEEIAEAIKLSRIPVVAFIRGTGASAAYWAVSGAPHIIASKNSSVGGIGVTSSYVEKLDEHERYIQIISGKYKDYGSSKKNITKEEMALMQRDNDIVYHNFIQAVASNRKLSVENVKRLADGSTIMGEMAKRSGLIDEIGSLYEVRVYLAALLGEEVTICWK
jgi:protease-4